MAITAPAYMAHEKLPASMGTASALSKTMIIILVCVRLPLLFLFTVKFPVHVMNSYPRQPNIAHKYYHFKLNTLTLMITMQAEVYVLEDIALTSADLNCPIYLEFLCFAMFCRDLS